MGGKGINFENKKINKSNFYKSKKLFKIEDIDINKILVSKKESYGTKNWLRSLCIRLPQMIDYVKCFDSIKTMSFKVNNNKLFKNILKYEKKLAA